MKFSWSANSTKVAWLTSHSNRYKYGKRLVVFEVNTISETAGMIFEDTEHDITDYELCDDRIVYLIAGEAAYREHRF